jgi:uncharacterized protein YgiM (DUF1202 family)
MENYRLSVQADQISSSEMRSKIRQAEERSQMQVEDCQSYLARELLRFRAADADNKKFKAELLRQKDQWARAIEEK